MAGEQQDNLSNQIDSIIERAHALDMARGYQRKARLKGFSEVEAKLAPRVSGGLASFIRLVEGIRDARLTPVEVPSIEILMAELKQMLAEFEVVQWDGRNRELSIVTDPIELETSRTKHRVHLGRFEIALRLGDLRLNASSGSFRLKALDPNPASGFPSVTHPHIRSEEVCAGEAHMPIKSALREGRICDAFMILNNLIHVYNSDSPHVRLEGWNGYPCHSCGVGMSRDDRYRCEDCAMVFCDECTVICEGCGTHICSECEIICAGCGEGFCNSCTRVCQDCGLIICRDCRDGGLCECKKPKPNTEETVADDSNQQQQGVNRGYYASGQTARTVFDGPDAAGGSGSSSHQVAATAEEATGPNSDTGADYPHSWTQVARDIVAGTYQDGYPPVGRDRLAVDPDEEVGRRSAGRRNRQAEGVEDYGLLR